MLQCRIKRWILCKKHRDAILRQIITYVANPNFYLGKEEADAYKISDRELKRKLEGWKNNFKGILNGEYIGIIEDLSKLSLKHVKSPYGE